MDIIAALNAQQEYEQKMGKEMIAIYYENLADTFQPILDKLQELPGEQRVAKLVMAL